MQSSKGVVAAGHPLTASTAELILKDGGNAFDAAIAALATACVVEPALASLGGGGFMLARPANGEPVLYDFFVHTPRHRRPESEIDFRPILVDFGAATQEFHIGRGAVAVPGVAKGLFEVHQDLASMPMTELVAPAMQLARNGTPVNDFQAYVMRLLEDIFTATPQAAALYGSRERPGELVAEGETLYQPEFADTLDQLSREGADLFYRGEIARALEQDMKDGGHITALDLEQYRVEKRRPLSIAYHGVQLLSNPPPSSGGLLIAFALGLLEGETPGQAPFGSSEYVTRLATAMDLTSQARLEAGLAEDLSDTAANRLLDPDHVAAWRQRISGRARANRGTTHISLIDSNGNIATLSTSNGEGSAYVIPGTGIALNNMLGEEDLNPGGFHRWPRAERMTSMMAPSVARYPDGRLIATGSGGSNRIRTAILHVLLNLVDFDMDVESAVSSPRIHYENNLLSVEGGFDRSKIAEALSAFPQHKLWEARNMFFGGAHTVVADGREFGGAGDPRRGGVCVIAA